MKWHVHRQFHVSCLLRRGLLTRLGETHQSSCHPERESRFLPIIRPHPQGGYITLNLTRVNINPFLSEDEKEAEEAAQRFSLVSDSRYFVYHTSYVSTSDDK